MRDLAAVAPSSITSTWCWWYGIAAGRKRSGAYRLREAGRQLNFAAVRRGHQLSHGGRALPGDDQDGHRCTCRHKLASNARTDVLNGRSDDVRRIATTQGHIQTGKAGRPRLRPAKDARDGPAAQRADLDQAASGYEVLAWNGVVPAGTPPPLINEQMPRSAARGSARREGSVGKQAFDDR